MYRTRFRPTANGYLHLGGAYVARQNYWHAQARSGQLVLIADDVAVVEKLGPRNAEQVAAILDFRDAMIEDLTWLGYPPDLTVLASDLQPAHLLAAKALGCEWPAVNRLPGLHRYIHHLCESGGTFDYTPWLVAGRVSDDHELGITGFVRGADLACEAALYDHFGRCLYGEGYEVRQAYGPVILDPETDEKASKTAGAISIRDLRAAGVQAKEIDAALANIVGMPGMDYGASHIRYATLNEEWSKRLLRKLRRGRGAAA